MDPVQEFQNLCQTHKIQNAEFVFKKMNNEWTAVIPFARSFVTCGGVAKTKKMAKKLCALEAINKFSQALICRTDLYARGIELSILESETINKQKTFVCIPKFKLNIEDLCTSVAESPEEAEERCCVKISELFDKLEVNAARFDRLLG